MLFHGPVNEVTWWALSDRGGWHKWVSHGCSWVEWWVSHPSIKQVHNLWVEGQAVCLSSTGGQGRMTWRNDKEVREVVVEDDSYFQDWGDKKHCGSQARLRTLTQLTFAMPCLTPAHKHCGWVFNLHIAVCRAIYATPGLCLSLCLVAPINQNSAKLAENLL
jgi:hypothetical protein